MKVFGIGLANDFVCTCGAFSHFECICLWEYEDDDQENDEDDDEANDQDSD